MIRIVCRCYQGTAGCPDCFIESGSGKALLAVLARAAAGPGDTRCAQPDAGGREAPALRRLPLSIR